MNTEIREVTVRPDYAAATPVDLSSLWAIFRPSERVVLVYFIYTALLSTQFSMAPGKRIAAFATPLFLWVLGYAGSACPRFWTSVVRDWLPAPLVLLAYWQLDWFDSATYLHRLEQTWLVWDRTLLNQYGLRVAIESLGAVGPSALELSYTLLYCIPPLSIGALYLARRRDRVDRFLFPFLLGTFSAYALLPLFPTHSPRVEFARQDLPNFDTAFRRFNLWILSRGDIRISVFPSGHVATAFSAAFAMTRAWPERLWAGRVLLGIAVLVLTATIYGRYHYAADGLAGLALSVAAMMTARVWQRE